MSTIMNQDHKLFSNMNYLVVQQQILIQKAKLSNNQKNQTPFHKLTNHKTLTKT